MTDWRFQVLVYPTRHGDFPQGMGISPAVAPVLFSRNGGSQQIDGGFRAGDNRWQHDPLVVSNTHTHYQFPPHLE